MVGAFALTRYSRAPKTPQVGSGRAIESCRLLDEGRRPSHPRRLWSGESPQTVGCQTDPPRVSESYYPLLVHSLAMVRPSRALVWTLRAARKLKESSGSSELRWKGELRVASLGGLSARPGTGCRTRWYVGVRSWNEPSSQKRGLLSPSAPGWGTGSHPAACCGADPGCPISR